MRKVIGIVCLSLFALAGNAQDLKGTWTLEKVNVEVVKENLAISYTPSDDFIGKELFPYQLVFENNSVQLIHANSDESGQYSINGTDLKISTAAAGYVYGLSANGTERMLLTITFDKASLNQEKSLIVRTYTAVGEYLKTNN